MYESHYVFQFARLWGAKESSNGIIAANVLLGNSQNPFDVLLGDVAGKTGCRYFLIEFKRERDGLGKEVDPTQGKPHRIALYEHLRKDQSCRDLARYGHFGAYADSNGQLCFEPYAHSIAPVESKAKIVADALLTSKPYHELNARSFTIGFDQFYDSVNEKSVAQNALNPKLFSNGLGLPETAFKEYIHCMYQHLEAGENSKGAAVLMIIDPETGEARVVFESVEQLVADLEHSFRNMTKSMKNKFQP